MIAEIVCSVTTAQRNALNTHLTVNQAHTPIALAFRIVQDVLMDITVRQDRSSLCRATLEHSQRFGMHLFVL